MKKTIKEKYRVNEIELNNYSTSLEKWFNEVIYKSEIELNISDLLRMIRQNLFIDLALILSIKMLKENPLIGEYYDGELIGHLLKVDKGLLLNYKEDIKEILFDAQQKVETFKWESNEDKDEVCDNLRTLYDILK